MDVGLHHVPKRGVDQPVPGQRQLAGECTADDVDAEVPLPAARTGMPGVLVAVVGDVERLRGLFFGEQGADALDPLRVEPWQVGLGPAGAHGRTLRNGRTSTRA